MDAEKIEAEGAQEMRKEKIARDEHI